MRKFKKELTHPERAGHLHPITCRWFEAIASGTVVAGKAPSNPAFDCYFGSGIIQEVTYGADWATVLKELELLLSQSKQLSEQSISLSSELFDRLTWNERVRRIVGTI